MFTEEDFAKASLLRFAFIRKRSQYSKFKLSS